MKRNFLLLLICILCVSLFSAFAAETQEVEEHTHDWSWKNNDAQHWKECSVCGIDEATRANHQEAADNPEICGVCGAAICIPTIPGATPEPMSLVISQNSTVITAGTPASASWTYTGPMPITYLNAYIFEDYPDGSSKQVWASNDKTVTSCSYTPTKGTRLSLTVMIKGEDGRTVTKYAYWTVNAAPATPEPMSIAISQNSTVITAGTPASASWTYTGPMPITYLNAYIFEDYPDGSSKQVWASNDKQLLPALILLRKERGWH